MQQKQPTASNNSSIQVSTSPECLSAVVLTICNKTEASQINEMIDELLRQSSAVHNGDMTRAESMLVAQAHTLDGIFAKLASLALSTKDLDRLDQYMKLAFRAQNQSRATLETLSAIKTPKQVAFVRQANIGNQVQVNNQSPKSSSRTQEKNKSPNELLENDHGKRMDTRTSSKASRTDSAMATLEKKHRSKNT
ncbi:hypothetical protein [Methylobacillus sp. Pita1]|uniref:hypothetical protein n=1 Tax=Methylobacillus sp. Pita1 TaxID=3382642 RepID=UPI0038B457F3